MTDEQTPITLGSKEIDPQEEAAYRERIKKARQTGGVGSLKGTEPVGGVERPQMPAFRQAPRTSSGVQPGAQPGDPPQGVVPRPPGSPAVRPETVQQIKEAVAAGQAQEKAESQEKALDEKKLAEDAKLAEIFENMDFGAQRSQVDRILDNKKRMKEIEERCAPMDVEDLLMRDEVRQRVPIIPEKFEPLFRSITPIETLYLKSRMAKESVQTDQYLAEKYNLMLLTCCLLDINKLPLPEHRKMTSDGTFEVDDKLFDQKLQTIMRKSGYVVADLGVNYNWFDIRVRKLLNPDDLKNG